MDAVILEVLRHVIRAMLDDKEWQNVPFVSEIRAWIAHGG